MQDDLKADIFCNIEERFAKVKAFEELEEKSEEGIGIAVESKIDTGCKIELSSWSKMFLASPPKNKQIYYSSDDEY